MHQVLRKSAKCWENVLNVKKVCESEVKNAVKDYEKNIANNAKKNILT